MRKMNENINQLNKIIYMRRLLLLIFAFVSFVGINVGRAQSALPYEINFGDSQDGWSAVDNTVRRRALRGSISRVGLISRVSIMAVS